MENVNRVDSTLYVQGILGLLLVPMGGFPEIYYFSITTV